MSLPLHDLGSIKVSEVTHSLLKAEAMSQNMETSSLARAVLDKWAADRLHVLSLADQLHEAKGFGKITGESK